ncbi:MAG TPA: hypothetical protein VGD65_26075 [Chryseosolibacter sp.]
MCRLEMTGLVISSLLVTVIAHHHREKPGLPAPWFLVRMDTPLYNSEQLSLTRYEF